MSSSAMACVASRAICQTAVLSRSRSRITGMPSLRACFAKCNPPSSHRPSMSTAPARSRASCVTQPVCSGIPSPPAILILGVLASVWRNHRAFVLVGVRPFQRRWGGWECEPGAPGHTAAAKRRWQAGRGTLPLGSRWSPAVVGWLARCVMTVRARPRGGWPWGGLPPAGPRTARSSWGSTPAW